MKYDVMKIWDDDIIIKYQQISKHVVFVSNWNFMKGGVFQPLSETYGKLLPII